MSVPKAVFIPFHTNKRLDKQLHVKINDEYLWSDVWPLRRADRPSFKYSANLVGWTGKIQGGGRKFLDRFKSYFGSQISSQSLNEIHICRLQPKSATKGDLFIFHIFSSLIVSSSRRMLPFDVWQIFMALLQTSHVLSTHAVSIINSNMFPSNNVNTSLVPILVRQSYSRRYAIFSVPSFSVACLTKPLT